MSSDRIERAPGEQREGLRVGLVATDPLRVLGLQTIFETWNPEAGEENATVVPLSLPALLEDADLTLAMIDARCTDHLFVLLETLRRKRPSLRMIVIGDSDEPAYIQRVIGAGAKGYLKQTVQEGEIRMALGIVSDGSVWAPRKVLARLLDGTTHAEASAAAPAIHFTDREIEVLRLLIAGMGNREIALELNIDRGTVKAHISRLMRKVGAKNRVELTVRAIERDFAERRSINS